MPYTTINQDNRLSHDKFCYAFGCSNEASEKINVSAGTFGTITLNLCTKCVKIFQERNVSSSPGVP
jgi:hypothetical protein